MSLIIPGKPIAAPRMTQRDKWLKRPCVVSYFAWRALVRGHVPKGHWPTIRKLTVEFYLPFPKSYSKAKREDLADTPMEEKPDLDNLVKSLLDCFGEDKQVSHIVAKKTWDDGQGPRTVLYL